MLVRRCTSIAVCAAVLAVGAFLGDHAPPGYASSRVHAQQPTVTFTEDVAPIVFGACASCHRPAGSAPFSLLTYAYADVRPWARSIKRAVLGRSMPPWKPEPGHGTFVGERRLTDEQIATIARWVDQGAIEGDPAFLPPPPSSNSRWQLGEPDLVLQMPPYTLRATGDDVYRNFVLPITATDMRYVKAWEFRPGNPRVVHHSTMEFDPTGSSRQLDAHDPEPGYAGLIPHSVRSPEGFFLGWLPGHTPYVAPEGMAWPLTKNADLVMMLHLRPSGKEETVQASLGLYFSDKPPSLRPSLIRLTRQHLDIPPGERRYVVADSFTLDVDVDVYTVQPHAHYLAKEVKSVATSPDGTRTWLIDIRHWDFDWQGIFRFARPEFLPAGTTITMEYLYDNSAENPRNPHHPPQRVTYGQRTTDEMADLWLQVVPRMPADRARLERAVRDKIVREEIVGLEKRLETDPANVALHDDVALLYAETGNLARTAAHFTAVVRLRPDSAAAHYNLGHARLLQGDRAAAGDHFRSALALRPNYALAHDGLGLVLHDDGKLSEAVEHFQQAPTFAPKDPDAHQHLAAALRNLGRLDEAARYYRQALQIDPTRQAIKAELAEMERQLAHRSPGKRP